MKKTKWLDDRETRAWRGFVQMRSKLGAKLNRRLQQDSGLSDADYEALVYLSEADQRQLRLYQLGAALEWEKSRLSHHLTRMEKRGLVSRQFCESDARGAFVVLTDEGMKTIERAAPLHLEAVREYFIDLMTPEQLDQIAQISDIVLEKLSNETSSLDCDE